MPHSLHELAADRAKYAAEAVCEGTRESLDNAISYGVGGEMSSLVLAFRISIQSVSNRQIDSDTLGAKLREELASLLNRIENPS